MGGALDSRFTFSRAGNATYINSSGYVAFADANMLLQSESLGSSPWSAQNGATATNVSITNPTGGATSTQITAGSGSSAVGQSPTFGAAVAHTLSIWVRSGTSTRLNIGIYSGAGFVTGTISVISGSATVSGTDFFTVTNLTSTWTRLQIVYTTLSAGTVLIYPDTASSTAGLTIYAWGAQLNQGSTAQTYYQTTTAAYYAPRFDYDPTTLAAKGLLIEGSATNIALYSQSINSSLSYLVGVNTTLTQNTTDVLDPAGGNTATKIALTASTYCSRAQIVAVSGSTQYTFSYYIRGTPNNQCRIYSYAGYAGDLVTLTDHTYTTNSWTRVTTTFTTNAATTGIYIYVCSRNTAASPAEVIYVWGAQLETGNGASSYIPTVASQVQRVSDECYIADISSFNYSNTNASMAIEFMYAKQATSYIEQIGFMAATDLPTLESFANALSFFTAVRGASLSSSGQNEVSRTFTLNTAIKYSYSVDTTTDPILRVNLNSSASSGNKVGTGNMYTATRFVFSRVPAASYGLYLGSFTIKSVKYWPTTKTAAELAALTA